MSGEAPELVFVPRYARRTWAEKVGPAYLLIPAALGAYTAIRRPGDWLGWVLLIGVPIMGLMFLYAWLISPRRLSFGAQLVMESWLASKRIPIHEIDLISPDRIHSQQGNYWMREFENPGELRRVLEEVVSRGWLTPDKIASELGGTFPSMEEIEAQVEAERQGEPPLFVRLLRPALACFVPAWTLALVLLLSGVVPPASMVPPSLQLLFLALLFVFLGAQTLYRLRWSEERVSRFGRWSSWAALILLIVFLALRMRR